MAGLALIEERPAPGRRYDARPDLTFGRVGCDVLVGDPDVSRRHAILRSHGAGIAIEDLGSRNGTFVNGRRIHGLTELRQGDELRLGSSVWRVAASATATAPPLVAGPRDETVITPQPEEQRPEPEEQRPQPDERRPQPEPREPPERARAGFGTRLGASLLDGLVLGLVGGLLVVALQGVGFALAWIGALVYFVLLEGGARGQTLGKRGVGITVTDAESGHAIGHGRATVRYLTRILSALPLFLGYLWMLWDPRRQTWHDKLAGTVVAGAASSPPSR